MHPKTEETSAHLPGINGSSVEKRHGHFAGRVLYPNRNRYTERTSNRQKFNQESVTSMKVTKALATYDRHSSCVASQKHKTTEKLLEHIQMSSVLAHVGLQGHELSNMYIDLGNIKSVEGSVRDDSSGAIPINPFGEVSKIR